MQLGGRVKLSKTLSGSRRRLFLFTTFVLLRVLLWVVRVDVPCAALGKGRPPLNCAESLCHICHYILIVPSAIA